MSDTGDGSKATGARRTADRVLRRRAGRVRRRASSSCRTGSTATAPARCGQIRRGRGRHLRRARRCSPATPARRAPPGTFCARCSLSPFIPSHRVVAATGSARYGDSRGRVQAAAARARRRECRSLRSSATSSPQIEPPAQLLPARRAVGALPLGGAWHLRGDGALAVHLDLASSAAARRAFACCATSASAPRSARTAARRSTVRRATSCTSTVDEQRARRAARGGRALAARRAARAAAASASSASSCCRGAYLRGALLGAGSLSGPRDPHLELRTADARRRRASSPRWLRARASSWPWSSGGTHAAAYAKGHEPIADLLALAGAGRHRARARRAGRRRRDAVAREPPRERRRGEPRAHRAARRTRSSRRSGRSTLDALPHPARGDGRAAPAAPVAHRSASWPPKRGRR